jgi:hypothetical protein
VICESSKFYWNKSVLARQMVEGFNYVRGAGFLRWSAMGEKLNRREVFSKRTMLRIQILYRLRSGLAVFLTLVVSVKSVIATQSCVIGRGFRGAKERHDMKMLIDLTKQLLGPTSWIQFGNGERQDLVVVDRENRLQIFPGIQVTDAMRRIRMPTRCVRAGELNGRMGRQPDGMAHRSPVALPELTSLPGTPNDESAALLEQIQAGEVQVSAIEQIKTRVGQHLIENMDVVAGTDGRINIGRNAGAIEKSTQFERNVAEMGRRSSKHRQTRIGGGGIQRIEGRVHGHAERFAAIRFANLGYESLRKPAKDKPVARFIGVRQKVARPAGPKFRITKLQRLRVQRSFDVAHTLASAELCEGRTQKLAPAGEATRFAIVPAPIRAAREFRRGKKIRPPDKDRSATVHAPLAGQLRSSCSADVILKRFRSFANPNPAFAEAYGAFRTQPWESTGIN